MFVWFWRVKSGLFFCFLVFNHWCFYSGNCWSMLRLRVQLLIYKTIFTNLAFLTIWKHILYTYSVLMTQYLCTLHPLPFVKRRRKKRTFLHSSQWKCDAKWVQMHTFQYQWTYNHIICVCANKLLVLEEQSNNMLCNLSTSNCGGFCTQFSHNQGSKSKTANKQIWQAHPSISCHK